jgi:class 3 adenylate cyclase
MPTYMDIHDVPGATAEAVAAAHLADVDVQGKHGVVYHKYWLNEAQGKIYCLCSAPTAEAARDVHQEAHGLLANKIIEVAPEIAEGFLGGSEINAAGAAVNQSGERDSGIRTILFTDVVGSTEMTQRLGDDASMAVLKIHDTIVREALVECGGREIKHTGDGIMASFASAASAVRGMVQMQKALFAHAERTGETLKVRIGAAAGEPVERDNDLFGSTVQLASRLCSHAEPEQCLVSNVVAELCIGKGLVFEDLGDVTLRGFDRAVRVHSVRV